MPSLEKTRIQDIILSWEIHEIRIFLKGFIDDVLKENRAEINGSVNQEAHQRGWNMV